MNYKTFDSVPSRSPLKVIEVMIPYIQNKIVCEIGCKQGDILYGISKYAKECIGYEIERDFIENAKTHNYECPTEIILGDFFKGDNLNQLKKSFNPEVFYSFSHGKWYIPWFENVHKHFPSSTIITAADPGNTRIQAGADERGWINKLNDKYSGELLEVEYSEKGQRANTFILHIWEPK